jgi:hypothetical protein
MPSWVSSDAFGSGIRCALGTAAPTACTFAVGSAATPTRARRACMRGSRSTGSAPNERGSQRAESRLLLQLIPPDDIRNTTAIAKKLRRSVVIEEHFEFAIRAAHTVKISACAHCILRVPRGFRHTTARGNTA